MRPVLGSNNVWAKGQVVTPARAGVRGRAVADMVADIFTKYVKVSVWLRHLAYLLNDAVRAVADVVW